MAWRNKLEEGLLAFQNALNKRNLLVLCGIFIVNLVLRIIRLDYDSIYMDEGQTMFQVMRSIERIVNDYAKNQQNAPFYFVLLHFWVKLFGLSIFKARLFSVVAFSVASVVFYKLIKKHSTAVIALAASILFLLSRDLLKFSHEARGYALVSLLVVSSFYVYSLLVEKPKLRWAIALFLLNTCMLYTHYLTIYVFVVQAITSLFFIFRSKRVFWFYALSQVAVVLAFLPWVPVLFQVVPEMGSYWISKSKWSIFKNVFFSIVEGRSMTTVAFIILGIAIATWIAKLKSLTRYQNAMIFMFMLWGGGVFFMNYMVGKHYPVFLYKYTLYGVMGFIGAYALLARQLPFSKILTPLAMLLAIFWYSKRFTFSTPKMENWKEAVAFIESKTDGNEMIFLQSSYTYKCFAAYYKPDLFDEPREMRKQLARQNIHTVNIPRDAANRWKKKEKPEEVILVRSHWRGADKHGKLKAYLNREFDRQPDSLKVRGVEVYLYQRKD